MNTYKVWDDECGDGTEFAINVDACHPSEAAEKFAEQDIDGVYDGSYAGGRRIGVQDKDGTVTKWDVTVEYDPTFYAVQLTDWTDQSKTT